MLFWQPAQADNLKTPESFLSEAFPGKVPEPQSLWFTGRMQEAAREILGRNPAVRTRYWREGNRTVWILEQVGKYKPITAGIIVDNGAIEKVKVLVYRESHGWEVKYPFFTDQFIGTRLEDMQEYQLNKNIDGIAGATLSVRALVQLARLALTLHGTVINE